MVRQTCHRMNMRLLLVRTVAVILLFVADSGSFAQPYRPMLVPGNAWQLHYWGLGGALNEIVELHEDSTFDGFTYLRMNASLDGDRWVREDTASKRVYMIEGEEEVLLYDFAMIPGDERVVQYAGGGAATVVLDSISLFLPANVETVLSPLKLFWLHGGGTNGILWVEGVGSAAGPLFSPGIPFYQSWRLLCHQDSLGQVDFRLLYYDVLDCLGPEYTLTPEATPGVLAIGPNPTHGLVRVRVDRPLRILLSDLSGRVVKSFERSSHAGVVDLDITDLPPGPYLMYLTDDLGNKSNCHVMKE